MINVFESRKTTLSATLLLGSLALAPGVRADPDVYQRVLRSTVWVVVSQPGGRHSCATGWLADRDRRLVVTNDHVVHGKDEVGVYFPQFADGNLIVESGHYVHRVAPIAGRVLARDPLRDLALVQLASVPDGAEAIPLAEQGPRPGDAVHAIGNSGVLDQIDNGTLWWYVPGKVRQVFRQQITTADGVRRDFTTVQSDAATNHGDSGGPVVNDRGQVVGVVESHHPEARLITSFVEVREVRTLLRAQAAPVGAGLVGTWVIHGTDRDHPSVAATATFEADGSFRLAGAVTAAGMYRLAGDKLSLDFSGGPRCPSVLLTWGADGNHFHLTFSNSTWSAARR
jgi:hypothetical protein